MLLREITRELIFSICSQFIGDDDEDTLPTQETINSAINYINDLRCKNLFTKENFKISLYSNGSIDFYNSKHGFLFNVCGKKVDYTFLISEKQDARISKIDRTVSGIDFQS